MNKKWDGIDRRKETKVVQHYPDRRVLTKKLQMENPKLKTVINVK